jgi:hypothetical protein
MSQANGQITTKPAAFVPPAVSRAMGKKQKRDKLGRRQGTAPAKRPKTGDAAIFAAIAEHCRLWRAAQSAERAYVKLQKAHPDLAEYFPSIVATRWADHPLTPEDKRGRPIMANNPDDIDRLVNPALFPKKNAEKQAEWVTALDRHRAARKKCGLDRVWSNSADAALKARTAFDRLVWLRPSTPAGAAALARYVLRWLPKCVGRASLAYESVSIDEPGIDARTADLHHDRSMALAPALAALRRIAEMK